MFFMTFLARNLEKGALQIIYLLSFTSWLLSLTQSETLQSFFIRGFCQPETSTGAHVGV